MITPKEIREKAERKYSLFLQSLVEELPFEKLIIRGDKSYTKSSLSEFEKEIKAIIGQSKEKKNYGYTLEFQQVKTKSLGVQDLPVSIFFETEKDYLKFLGKENEANSFKKNIEMIIRVLPELKDWIIKNLKLILDNDSKWNDLLKVCNYFKQNPKPNLYIRELPIKVHTKFIENNQAVIKSLLDVLILEHSNTNEKEFEKRFNLKYAEPQIRFKILDRKIAQSYFSNIDDIAVPVSQFECLALPVQTVLVIENKTSLYTTLTLPKMKHTIAIFGSGYGVANLKNVKWLENLELLYWGDIDAQGFEILSQFRGYFKQVKSILMDQYTFDNFFEGDQGTLSQITTKLNLTESEHQLYEKLKTENWRLEQEKIPLDYVINCFNESRKANREIE